MVSHLFHEDKVFYHGSCSISGIGAILLPPNETGVISEKGRNKNLDKVFFTEDIGIAKIYAGRAAKSIGGEPILFRVVSPTNAVCIDDTPGATIWNADWAFLERIK